MRKYVKEGNFSVNAISGTYVVVLGFNAKTSATKGLLGFAIERTDHTENEKYWLKGLKTFEATVPNPVPGEQYSTLEHPIQSFHWGDYTAKADHKYTYRAVPLFGNPKNLQQGTVVSVDIDTESEDKETHAVYFNRGVAGSQAYAVKFLNKDPDEFPDRRAFVWLSRGLEEAMLNFIGRPDGDQYGLRASFYEFNYAPVLEAFKKAADRGVDVKIVYDSRKESPRKENDEAIDKAGIRSIVKRRQKSPSYLSHNKFIVLLKDNKPVEVWTGSTNVTTGGIFGQANVGHLVRDEKVADEFLNYWKELYEDKSADDLRKWSAAKTPDLEGVCQADTIKVLFSPRKTLKELEWFADRIDHANEMVCLTSAFEVNSLLEEVLTKSKDCLRYIILDKKGSDYDVLNKVPNVQVAFGSHLAKNTLYRWTKEKLTDFNVHVKYIHTKFLLLDPFGDCPTVITGSANFSEASTTKNDENMLVITGDKRVADIYLGEFMRLFFHFYARDLMNNQKAEPSSEAKKRSYLKPDDSWTEKYYLEGSRNKRERVMFGRKLL